MKKRNDSNYIEEYVQIGGISQYLLHYQAKSENPVILFLHGGPGQSESMLAYYIENYAERNYNIVYYDQRGAGKTYIENKKCKPDTQSLKQDLLELVLYLKKRYQKEKIALLGHSWGSVLGSMFALEHPEHTLCYIGCGQVVNIIENEIVGFNKLKEAVVKSGRQKDLSALKKIGVYPQDNLDMKVFIRKVGKVRKLQSKYHLAASIDKSVIKVFLKSPITGFRDAFSMMIGIMVNKKVLEELIKFDLRSIGNQYQVPVFYILGERDQQTPVELGIKYFDELKAPLKKLYLIKNAGHITMLDNRKDYRSALCEIVSFMDSRA